MADGTAAVSRRKDTPRRLAPRMQGALLILVSALVGLAAAGGRGDLVAGIVVASALVAAAPLATAFVVLLVAQELDPAHASSSSNLELLTLGHQAYFSTALPLAAILVALAAAVAILRFGVDYTRDGRAFLAVSLALTAWAVLAGLYWGVGPYTAMSQDARPFIVLIAAFLLALSACGSGQQVQTLRAAVLGAFGFLGLLAIYLLARGVSWPPAPGSVPLFYDSATAAVAGAVVLGVLFSRERLRLGHWCVLLIASGIVLVSFRRSVWIAFVFVFLVALLVSRRRGRGIGSLLAVILVGGVLVGTASSTFQAQLGGRVETTIESVRGSASDDSTQGHLSDLSAAWQAIQNSWVTGVGPEAPAADVPGLVATEGRVYVHNELLLDWLRFGALGALLIVALLALMVALGIRVLQRSPSAVGASAAALLIAAPVSMMTAPFLTTTVRWPALLGLAAGIAVHELSASGRFSEAPIQESVAADGPPRSEA